MSNVDVTISAAGAWVKRFSGPLGGHSGSGEGGRLHSAALWRLSIPAPATDCS